MTGGAVIYCRVSTKEQTRNLSLSTQLKACIDLCARHSLNVLQSFTEEGESAKTADRPQLKRLLDYCREQKGRIQSLVVYNVSRLARDKHDHFVIRTYLQKLGITLKSATEPLDDSPAGMFIEGVLAAAAQFDNDVKAERTRAGMLAALELGRWTHQPPLGYLPGSRSGQSLTPDPERAAEIRHAFEQVAEGASEREALRQATFRGLRTKRGRVLSPQTFSAVLKNPVYSGRIELRKWNISRRGDWEPLVPQQLFSQVQARRRSRGDGVKPHRRQNPDFPLRVFVRCSRCEAPLTGSWSRGRAARYAYYSCRGSGRVRVRRERLETAFLNRLRALQPRREYLRLFGAIVQDVWREQQAQAREQKWSGGWRQRPRDLNDWKRSSSSSDGSTKTLTIASEID